MSAYQTSVANNSLYHLEMMAAFNQFLEVDILSKRRSISFADIGCGDAYFIAKLLQQKPVDYYVGIDISQNALTSAEENLANLKCKKVFILENMITAITRISFPINVIFSSYAVHHLSFAEKYTFIENCKNKLPTTGYLVIIDGIREENQTRDEWLDRFEAYYLNKYPEISKSQLEEYMEHPRTSDYPETISTFESIAHQQNWDGFEVVTKIGLLAFMVFRNQS